MIAPLGKSLASVPDGKGIAKHWFRLEGGSLQSLSLPEKLASPGDAHFIEAGSAMTPAPLAELYNGHQHNVTLIPQTAPGSAAQPVA